MTSLMTRIASESVKAKFGNSDEASYCTIFDLLEHRLDGLLPPADAAPQSLHRAMRYAVFSGGRRIRPRLLLAVAAACGAESPPSGEVDLALNAACAVELLHCASLIHDDLPVFDDAAERRGRPTVHILFGEPLAILAGDALLNLAYEIIAESSVQLAQRAIALIRLMGVATGSREGIIGGQSMEQKVAPERGAPRGEAHVSASEFTPDMVERYHCMKSAALFQLSAQAGAVVTGNAAHKSWGHVGQCLGLAFQLADDLCDVGGEAAAAGKPVGRDAALGRPNAVLMSGASATRQRMWNLFQEASTRARSLAPDSRPLIALFNQAGSQFGLTAA